MAGTYSSISLGDTEGNLTLDSGDVFLETEWSHDGNFGPKDWLFKPALLT